MQNWGFCYEWNSPASLSAANGSQSSSSILWHGSLMAHKCFIAVHDSAITSGYSLPTSPIEELTLWPASRLAFKYALHQLGNLYMI